MSLVVGDAFYEKDLGTVSKVFSYDLIRILQCSYVHGPAAEQLKLMVSKAGVCEVLAVLRLARYWM
jgi:hypothetical protein